LPEEKPVSKILIVDDDRATSTLLRTLFEIEGFTGVVCPRPDEVLSTARRERPDVILMDVHLAEVDSIQILRQIRADADLLALPVVMTSGMDVREKCEAGGASAFMQKPFKPSELVALIKQQLTPAQM
jgi:chemosensory pili system protein ChpA (sensor histidine kinase/response regulator)